MRIRDLEEYQGMTAEKLRAYLERSGWTIAQPKLGVVPSGLVLWRHARLKDMFCEGPAVLFYPDNCLSEDQLQEEAVLHRLCFHENRGPQAILRDITEASAMSAALRNLAEAARGFRKYWGDVADVGRVADAAILRGLNESDVALSRALAAADAFVAAGKPC